MDKWQVRYESPFLTGSRLIDEFPTECEARAVAFEMNSNVQPEGAIYFVARVPKEDSKLNKEL